MSEDLDAVLDRVRKRVEPSASERRTLDSVTDTLVERARSATAEVPMDVEVVLAGSTARNTWLAGDRDIDIFLRFPPETGRETLRTAGLEIGHEVLSDGREEYAEHPYVCGNFEGFQVDIVPCFAVDDATKIQSAVDRTPFHTRYIREHIDGRVATEIRLCKQFFTGIGVYGSDLRTRGFSGYLTELLVLEFGQFRILLREAANWHPPVRFDPAEHGTSSFDDPLVVVDPTDPDRNVAAVLSPANLARLQHFARELRTEPRLELFETRARSPLDRATVRERFASRNTTPLALKFTTPALVDDQLWPQLERSLASIADELDRRGFDVLRRDTFVTPADSGVGRSPREVVLLFELAVAERPAVERHEGPPVHVKEHAQSFLETYADRDVVGPFIVDDRYVVERPREYTTAREYLASASLAEVGLGADLEAALTEGHELLAGENIARLAEEFGAHLARYLDPTPRNS